MSRNPAELLLTYDRLTAHGKLSWASDLSQATRILSQLGLDTTAVQQGYVRLMAEYEAEIRPS